MKHEYFDLWELVVKTGLYDYSNYGITYRDDLKAYIIFVSKNRGNLEYRYIVSELELLFVLDTLDQKYIIDYARLLVSSIRRAFDQYRRG